MQRYIEEYVEYLKKVKKLSDNSCNAYRGDLRDFFTELNIENPVEATNTDIVAFTLKLKKDGRSPSTVNRKVASLKSFYRYLFKNGIMDNNPADNLKSPKIERKKIEYLTISEVEKILDIPDDSVKGKRDRSILEIMYATGIKASEVTDADVSDLNLRMGFITCRGEHGKARIVPIGRPARQALEEYIYDARQTILKNKDEQDALFLNLSGERMTRQGLWKILKEYAEKADIEKKITPQILRNSFAAHMIQNGADLKSLQELMGYEDITATQIYLTVSKNRIKEVYDNAHPRA